MRKLLCIMSLLLLVVSSYGCSTVSLSEAETIFIGLVITGSAVGIVPDSDEYWICGEDAERVTEVDNGDGSYNIVFTNCKITDSANTPIGPGCDSGKTYTLNGTIKYSYIDSVSTFIGSVEVTGDINGTCEINTTSTLNNLEFSGEGIICGKDTTAYYAKYAEEQTCTELIAETN